MRCCKTKKYLPSKMLLFLRFHELDVNMNYTKHISAPELKSGMKF